MAKGEFTIKWEDGSTSVLDMSKMPKSKDGTPILKVDDYLKAHEPSRLEEYREQSAIRTAQLDRVLDQIRR